MKKEITISILTAVILFGCTSTPGEDISDQKRPPKKIESLVVAGCADLAADLTEKNFSASDDDVYEAASTILFSNDRSEEAKNCCLNIQDSQRGEKCLKMGKDK